MSHAIALGLLSLLPALLLPAGVVPQQAGPVMRLTLRTRVQPFPAVEQWTDAQFTEQIPAAKSAIIITDMWDKH